MVEHCLLCTRAWVQSSATHSERVREKEKTGKSSHVDLQNQLLRRIKS